MPISGTKIGGVEAYQVILLIVTLLVFFYLLLVFYVVGHVLEFGKRLKAREKTLMVIQNEKATILSTYLGRLEETIGSSDQLSEAKNELSNLCFDANFECCKANAIILKSISTKVHFFLQGNERIEESIYADELASIFDDLDRNYRRSVAMYNSDVSAYNYWRGIVLCRPWVILLRQKKHDILA